MLQPKLFQARLDSIADLAKLVIQTNQNGGEKLWRQVYEELEHDLELAEVVGPRDVGVGDPAGEADLAAEPIERARLAGAEETIELLNALASEYYADGNLEKAREVFERSLGTDPDQPQIRLLLDDLLGQAQGS